MQKKRNNKKKSQSNFAKLSIFQLIVLVVKRSYLALQLLYARISS